MTASTTTRLLEASVEFERIKKELAETKKVLEESNRHLHKMLDEHEGLFGWNNCFGSIEFGEDYVVAAKFAQKHGRKYSARAEEKWLEEQLSELENTN